MQLGEWVWYEFICFWDGLNSESIYGPIFHRYDLILQISVLCPTVYGYYTGYLMQCISSKRQYLLQLILKFGRGKVIVDI